MRSRSRDPYLLRAAGICFLLAAFFLSLIVLAGCAKSTLGQSLNAGVAASAVADLVTSADAQARGGREANFVMSDRHAQQWIVKGAGVAAVIGIAALLDGKQRPTWAHVVRAIAIAINVAASVHNHQVLR